MTRVMVEAEHKEKVVRACTEPGYWTEVFGGYKDKPVWTHTQELGDRHVVDFNVYTPRSQGNDDEPATCWCEAVVFVRDEDDPNLLHEDNCIMGDDDPFSAPWSFDLDGKIYQVDFA